MRKWDESGLGWIGILSNVWYFQGNVAVRLHILQSNWNKSMIFYISPKLMLFLTKTEHFTYLRFYCKFETNIIFLWFSQNWGYLIRHRGPLHSPLICLYSMELFSHIWILINIHCVYYYLNKLGDFCYF